VEVIDCHFLTESVPHFRCQLTMNTEITDFAVYDSSVDCHIALSVIRNVVLTTFPLSTTDACANTLRVSIAEGFLSV
jgi:hypothetical protein